MCSQASCYVLRNFPLDHYYVFRYYEHMLEATSLPSHPAAPIPAQHDAGPHDAGPPPSIDSLLGELRAVFARLRARGIESVRVTDQVTAHRRRGFDATYSTDADVEIIAIDTPAAVTIGLQLGLTPELRVLEDGSTWASSRAFATTALVVSGPIEPPAPSTYSTAG
jgi:hypothetical protein